MSQVSFRSITKRYGALEIIKDLNLEINDHEFLVLVGPSGCGKSTTLRMLAGLEEISSGEIYIDDQPVASVPPWGRDIAMVFQNYALYPHMTVADNMAFGLKLRHVPKQEIKERVTRAAEVLGIGNLLDRRPKALSGGQRQRVAMGRALVRDPKVFLFDEPLSNLDAKLRVQMRAEIKKLQRDVNTTTLYVTHDQVEAMTLADRVVVMNGGQIEQIGRPQDLYHSPRTAFVAGFVGSPGMNFIPVRVEESGRQLRLRISSDLSLTVPAQKAAVYTHYKGRDMTLGLRPEHLFESRDSNRAEWQPLTLVADVVEPMGMETFIHGTLAGATVIARLNPAIQPTPGQPVKVTADMSHMHLIDPGTKFVV